MSQLHSYFFCPCCIAPNVFHHYPTLFAHIRDKHRDEPSFRIRCELSSSCGSRYSSFESYRCHIYRCHRTLIDSFDNNDSLLSNADDEFGNIENFFSGLTFNDQSQCADDPEACLYPDEESDEIDGLFSNFDSMAFPINDQENDFDKLVKFYTFFLLQLREHHLLPQKIVQLVSSNICTLINMIVKIMKTKASSFISITDCETTFAHVISMINSISKNEYQFIKQCKRYFNYQAPTEIVLEPADKSAYYIPLQQSLSYTLQNGQLLQTITDNIKSLESRVAQDKDLFLSNRQCYLVKKNLQRQTNPNILLLKLYSDGISITNPLGPSKDSHKLTCFYYLLDDLPEVIRSQVNSIGLHGICYTKCLNNDRSREILMKVLVEDFNRLQNDGITIPCLSSRIYFAFTFICGDNLASNEIGGFQKNFNRGYFCRHCFITYEQKHISLSDISFVPRTRLKHDMIVNQVVLNNDGHGIQGVKGSSWFKNLNGFHATESLPPDIMHDFGEDEEIDGSTLALLEPSDIIQIFPRIKDRLKFVHQRTKLISTLNEQQDNQHASVIDTFDAEPALLQSYSESDDNDLRNSSNENGNTENNNQLLSANSNSSPNNDMDMDDRMVLPHDYEGPELTAKMKEYIGEQDFSKFNPHTKIRGELLTLLFEDVTKSYQLLYPSNDEYLTMAKCLVKKLHIPSSIYRSSLKDWHESIKQKFKRERRPLQVSNELVKRKRETYGNGKTNGRPKKKSTISQAERRAADIPLINLADRENQNLLNIVNRMKDELQKDDLDNHLLHDLWKQSFNIRRLCIRELTVNEVLERFPGYRCPQLILAEVKDSCGVDLEENVNVLLSTFFYHIPDNDYFLSDVLPIRTIRILCKFFGDTVGNVLTHQEVLTPYPCLKVLDDKFELYLDFCLVTETSSCSTALALLIALYYVFEVQFGHHNRCSRLLYAVLFEDSHYLNKGLKHTINSWKYKIIDRSILKRKEIITDLVGSLTQPSTTIQHVSLASNVPNEITNVSSEQLDLEQFNSSRSNVITSTDIDKENINEYEDESDQSFIMDKTYEPYPLPMINESNVHHSSPVIRPVLASQSNLSTIMQNALAEPIDVQDFCFGSNSEKIHQVTESQMSPLTQVPELETVFEEDLNKSSSSTTRKRKKTPHSSSSISTMKTSERLASKRARLQ